MNIKFQVYISLRKLNITLLMQIKTNVFFYYDYFIDMNSKIYPLKYLLALFLNHLSFAFLV